MAEKLALVTGANKGIGLEICRQLAAKGLRVFLTARRPELGMRAAQELARAGLNVSFTEMDVSNPESIAAAAKRMASQLDHLDVLVNNAGIMEDRTSSALELSPDVARRTFETNTLGPLLVTQAFWPLLAKSTGARVINVSSGLASLEMMGTGYPSYRISKAGLNAVTRILAAQLAQHRIAVNSVSPGWVRTDMGGPSATDSVEQGADTVVWLATEAAQDLTGQFLHERKPIPW